MTARIRRGLYAITDTELLADGKLPEHVGQAIRGGARVIQYRDKQLSPAVRQHQAAALAELCNSHGIPLIINDDVALAAAVGADGVHLGEHDRDLQQVRAEGRLADVLVVDGAGIAHPRRMGLAAMLGIALALL